MPMNHALESPRTRFPMMAAGMLALLAGLYTGTQRMGWFVGGPTVSLASLHGPLMVCGFLGTLISLERAVALGRLWSYLAPTFTGLGALLLVFMPDVWAGPLLIAAGSAILLAIFVRVLRIQFEPFAVVMAVGAICWLVGNVFWLGMRPLYDVVVWWLAFLVLTIAGERLELSRMLLHRSWVQTVFLVLVAAFVAALVTATWAPDAGARLIGLVLVLVAGWLFLFDVARHTIKQHGLTRFIAACLLAGYAWLLVGGVLMAVHGAERGGPAYDAMLHAVFVGFVFSMIFGHAPIIFPSVLGVPLFYRPFFYVHLALLHGSLMLRIVGDTFGFPDVRRVGGLLNALAVLVFLAATLGTIIAERRRLRLEDG